MFSSHCAARALSGICPCGFASLDLTKAFDRVEYGPLFEALLEQGVPKPYCALLWKLYQNQSGKLQQGHGFSIQRGVRQGDVISPILFNAVLESAMRKWKRKLLASHGLVIAGEKITNIRYADDLMLYARSLQDLKDMTELLITELGAMGLQLNASKTKILTTASGSRPMHVELAGDSVEILSGRSKHKYLGKTLVGDLRHRAEVELGHRLQVTWAKFHKHRHVLTNKHVALKLRLKFFDSALSPTVLFGLATLPLSKSQLQRLDVTQRKMLRTIVGWVAVDSTDWKTTMQRMKNWMQHFVYIQLACGVIQFSGNNFVYLRVFVDIWSDGLQQQLVGILLTMPKDILQTNLFENVDAHKCDGMTTYGNLVKCNFNKKHGPFLLDILPYGVLLKTSTSSFVVKRLHCKLMALICLVS